MSFFHSFILYYEFPQGHLCIAWSTIAIVKVVSTTSHVNCRRINVGSRFQAEIPPLRNRLLMLYEEHLAQLVWSPWGDIASNTDTQERGVFTTHRPTYSYTDILTQILNYIYYIHNIIPLLCRAGYVSVCAMDCVIHVILTNTIFRFYGNSKLTKCSQTCKHRQVNTYM